MNIIIITITMIVFIVGLVFFLGPAIALEEFFLLTFSLLILGSIIIFSYGVINLFRGKKSGKSSKYYDKEYNDEEK